jgi:hypothetical protein
MGSASSLFYSSNDTEKQTLHRRITPSSDQFEEQQERWNALADHLTTDLRERSGYSIRTWLQGSYKFGTQTRPVRLGEEFDIDLGVYYVWKGSRDNGDYGPQSLKGFVRDSLVAYAADNPGEVLGVVPPKPRCERIRFKGDFHIDVPAYHLELELDERSLATRDGWEDSDPKAIYIWFRDSFDDIERAKVRRQIRYLKSWAALKFPEAGRPSSILLTVLIAEAALELGTLPADDEALRDLVEHIAGRLETDWEVPNPVDPDEHLVRMSSQQMQDFTRALSDLLDIATRACEAETEFAAADIWQEAFEHLFPMPEAQQALVEMAKWLPVRSVMPEIRVTAVSRNNPQGGRFSDMNRIGPIPKNCDIHFEVVNAAQLPANSSIAWMVRNEGGEAENTNDLGHFAGFGLKANEHSAYRGTHYMDCVVKVGGQTVAMRRVPVAISGIAMPRRNPSARPAFVRLRGRK